MSWRDGASHSSRSGGVTASGGLRAREGHCLGCNVRICRRCCGRAHRGTSDETAFTNVVTLRAVVVFGALFTAYTSPSAMYTCDKVGQRAIRTNRKRRHIHILPGQIACVGPNADTTLSVRGTDSPPIAIHKGVTVILAQRTKPPRPTGATLRVAIPLLIAHASATRCTDAMSEALEIGTTGDSTRAPRSDPSSIRTRFRQACVSHTSGVKLSSRSGPDSWGRVHSSHTRCAPHRREGSVGGIYSRDRVNGRAEVTRYGREVTRNTRHNSTLTCGSIQCTSTEWM